MPYWVTMKDKFGAKTERFRTKAGAMVEANRWRNKYQWSGVKVSIRNRLKQRKKKKRYRRTRRGRFRKW